MELTLQVASLNPNIWNLNSEVDNIDDDDDDDDDDNNNNNNKVLMWEYKIHLTCEIALRVAQIVNTQQLQHYIP